jgi:hypothetical protein
VCENRDLCVRYSGLGTALGLNMIAAFDASLVRFVFLWGHPDPDSRSRTSTTGHPPAIPKPKNEYDNS